MGNLHSVKNAFEYIGCETFISSDADLLMSADGLILPGVGAFPDAMTSLRKNRMDAFIKKYKGPILGICLGMQLLFDKSYEIRECGGLGIISGEVVKIEDCGLKIPHMGWNCLKINEKSRLFSGISDGEQVYFVHSYKAVVQSDENLAAVSDYGQSITAAVESGNIFGCQFHPEKSGNVGLKILDNFRRIAHDYTSGN